MLNISTSASTPHFPLIDGLCPNCGMPGRHDTLRDCIAALRDQMATMEDDRTRPSHGGSGRHDRTDNRFVILDGRRMILSDAARALGLSPATLHWRLRRRTKTKNYADVDVRAVGADKLLPPSGPVQRFVILDGRRVTLASAARELGLPLTTLWRRITRRLGRKNFQNVVICDCDSRPPQGQGPRNIAQ